MCWYGINPSYKVPHVRSFTPFPIPLAYPYQYPIYPPYTIIGDLIGAPETVENALLEAYKDSKIDFEFEKLKDALDKNGNKKISFSEWNQVVGSLYTAVKLEDSGELTNQEFLELLHLAILFEFNFHDKNQDGILTEFWVLFNDADTSKSLSEAFILISTKPQYDKRLFIDLPVQYMKTTSSEHGENMFCA